MLSVFEKMKRKINQALKKLANANEKAYGSERLDCCDLNNKDNGHKK